MLRARLFALFTVLVVLSGNGLIGQDAKKDEKKTEAPKKLDKADEPAAKAKGVLPANWKRLGLSDSQVQDVYKVQGKYNSEIDKLESKIKEIKAARDKDLKALLTPEQKKRLEDIQTGKDK
ncbi:hypothetical protein GobsT_38480 [Gemmata obscuriglobus]|uniref:Uncharacterized protein n=1 Tax=Gemmata obscuriglobus TaxID=114 RepID=A0A2Z3H2Y0_9BACT|nr:hypothetical protein [Gemmata obscuriglobus]AWM38067.1 hypothetical protein C1280_14405 [Gemmata obscuriglobus]QEG29059.1 hypothetical protein GobsT_38480 [Gemmata obscuriglobus]VTS07693.1 Uncharacterized protein OS=Planctomyces maris DSM 8797 GN=PM8797T_26255 PE=4 SV=1 [Gemmata obscuriglobus UQM 2246]